MRVGPSPVPFRRISRCTVIPQKVSAHSTFPAIPRMHPLRLGRLFRFAHLPGVPRYPVAPLFHPSFSERHTDGSGLLHILLHSSLSTFIPGLYSRWLRCSPRLSPINAIKQAQSRDRSAINESVKMHTLRLVPRAETRPRLTFTFAVKLRENPSRLHNVPINAPPRRSLSYRFRRTSNLRNSYTYRLSFLCDHAPVQLSRACTTEGKLD